MAKRVKLVWRGDKFRSNLTRRLKSNMQIAVLLLGDSLYQLIDVEGAPDYPRSEPGDPPKRETKGLRDSITEKVVKANKEEVVGHVIAGKDYAVHLELGTWKMAPRPFMKRTLVAEWPELKMYLLRE